MCLISPGTWLTSLLCSSIKLQGNVSIFGNYGSRHVCVQNATKIFIPKSTWLICIICNVSKFDLKYLKSRTRLYYTFWPNPSKNFSFGGAIPLSLHQHAVYVRVCVCVFTWQWLSVSTRSWYHKTPVVCLLLFTLLGSSAKSPLRTSLFWTSILKQTLDSAFDSTR